VKPKVKIFAMKRATPRERGIGGWDHRIPEPPGPGTCRPRRSLPAWEGYSALMQGSLFRRLRSSMPEEEDRKGMDARRAPGTWNAERLRSLHSRLSSPRERDQVEALRDIAAGPRLRGPAPLFRALRSEHSSVRAGAAWVLRSAGDPRGVGKLLPLLQDPDPSVRAMTAEALGVLCDPRSIDPLVTVLKDPDPTVRLHAAWALWCLNATGTARALVPLFHDPDPQVRYSAVTAVGRFRDPGAYGALVACLSDPSDRVRRDALLALGRIPRKGLAGRVRRFLRDPSERVRIASALVLGQLSDRASVPFLLRQYPREASFVRPSYLVALGRMHDRRAIPLLTKALSGKTPWVVVSALWALGEIRARPAAPKIRALFGSSSSQRVRGAAAEALGKTGTRRDLSVLIPALTDEAAWVRRGAALGVGHLRVPEAVDPLLSRLEDPDAEVRLATIWALGELKGTQSLPRLLEMLDRAVGSGASAPRGRPKVPLGKGRGPDTSGAPRILAEGEGAVRLVSDAVETIPDALFLAILKHAIRGSERKRKYLLRRMQKALKHLPETRRAQPLRTQVPRDKRSYGSYRLGDVAGR